VSSGRDGIALAARSPRGGRRLTDPQGAATVPPAP
jgi:hypothetical protein